MKVLVVDFAASEGGALSILKEYYEEILTDKNNDYYFLLSDNYVKEKSNIHIRVLKKYKKWIPRLYFDYFQGKKIIEELKPDIVLSLQNTIIHGTKIKQVLYMHQSLPFQDVKTFSFIKKKEIKLAIIQKLMVFFIKSSMKKANKIIVQTEWIKKSIVKKVKISSNKIEVVKPRITLSVPIADHNIHYNKFFYPTSNEIYKNNDLIYDACDLLNKDGITNFCVELTIDGMSSNKNVQKIGKIDRKDVFKKYTESVLIFPSYIETYGLPLLEARESNAVIFASDTPFSHEILDDYENAFFFNPFSPTELRELMAKSIRNEIKAFKAKKKNQHDSKTIHDILVEENKLKNVLWFTNIPSPYRVNFFNEYGKYVNLKVVFERNTSSERDQSWKTFDAYHFEYKILKGIKYGTDKTISIRILNPLRNCNADCIFLSNYSSITGMIAAFYMILKKIPYYIETDGGFAKKCNGFKEKIKSIIISHSKKCFSTSKEGDNYYLHYGAQPDNIIRYPFTSIYQKDIINCSLNMEEKKILRKKYNIKEKKIIVSVGRFVWGKGFDILLNAYSIIEDVDTGLYIIGGEPTKEYESIIKSKNIKNVHFIQFLPKEQIWDYLKLSNLFVLSTRGDIWGLVINEAMACGVPVITTDKCIAGLELIEDGKNGFIIPVNDFEVLAKRINDIINYSDREYIMGNHNIQKISKYTFEEMAKIHSKKI